MNTVDELQERRRDPLTIARDVADVQGDTELLVMVDIAQSLRTIAQELTRARYARAH